MVESARTVGLPATGDGCLAVASYVSRADWASDEGPQEDRRVAGGARQPVQQPRVRPATAAGSPISRRPGKYLTAALADGSELAGWPERARVADRLLTSRAPAWRRPWSPARSR